MWVRVGTRFSTSQVKLKENFRGKDGTNFEERFSRGFYFANFAKKTKNVLSQGN